MSRKIRDQLKAIKNQRKNVEDNYAHFFQFGKAEGGSLQKSTSPNVETDSDTSTNEKNASNNTQKGVEGSLQDTASSIKTDLTTPLIKAKSSYKNLVEFFQRKINIEKITQTKNKIVFPMYKVDGGLYEIYLIHDEGKFYLSDDGATYAELDKIFELKEADVIKNLVAILKQYNCRKHTLSNAFIIECTPEDIHIKMSYFIQALSFMLNMKIFYV